MAELSAILLSAVEFDNGPFVRRLNTELLTLSTGIFAETNALTTIPVPILGNLEDPNIQTLKFESGRLIFNEEIISAVTRDPITLVETPYSSNTPILINDLQTVTFYITGQTYDARNEVYSLFTEPIFAAVDTVDVNYDKVQLLLPFDFEVESDISGVIVNGDLVPNDLILELQETQRNGENYYLGVQSNYTYYMQWFPEESPSRWRIERIIDNPATPELLYENLELQWERSIWNSLNPVSPAPANVAYLYEVDPASVKRVFDKSQNNFQVVFASRGGRNPPPNNAQLVNTKYKYDSGPTRGSMYFPGGAWDWAYIVDSAGKANFGPGDDFTIEGWINFQTISPSNYTSLISRGTNATKKEGYTFYYFNNILYFGIPYRSNDIQAPWTPAINTWYHWAVTRTTEPDPEVGFTGVLRLYVNGILLNKRSRASDGTLLNLTYSSTENIQLGRGHDGDIFNGWLEDLRVTKGLARYGGNTIGEPAFTPPARPHFTSGPQPNDPLSGAVVTRFEITYDSYPLLPDFPIIQVNYESTINGPYFYRSLPLGFPTPGSNRYELVVARASASEAYLSEIKQINQGTPYTIDPPPGTFFYETTVPAVCCFTVTVCAVSAPDSAGDFYTPHIFSNALSTVICPFPNQADFIAYPTAYFNENGQQIFLDETNFRTLTPGLCFYGEGHTEIINLSANITPNVINYFWDVADVVTGAQYTVSANEIEPQKAFATIPTTIGSYPTIGISLYLSNEFLETYTAFVLTAVNTQPISSVVIELPEPKPRFYYDDSTGIKTPYPFYYSTVNLSGEPQPDRTKFKENIQVVSYGSFLSSFNTGLTDNYFLPADGTPDYFTAYLVANLYGQPGLAADPCFDLYSLVWRWSTFVGKPSSWNLFASTGSLPKTWDNQGQEITELSGRSPVYCYSDSVSWTLSAPNWSNTTTIEVSTGNNLALIPNYEYQLSYLSAGELFSTTSIYENTPIFLQGAQVVTCIISAFPFDWSAKSTLIFDSKLINVISRGDFQVFTPNRYVLTGTEVQFFNNSKGLNNIDKIVINLDSNITPVVTLTATAVSGNKVIDNFTAIYDTTGPKTLIVNTFYTTGYVITDVFANVLNVVAEYDYVEPINYETQQTELNLPWKEVPYIASNEWVVADNINSVLTKIYDNLSYLKRRGRPYNNEPTEFHGWLGTQPQRADFQCPLWTWDDLECLTLGTQVQTTENRPQVTWEDVQCVDSTGITSVTAGPLSACGRWEQHECIPSIQNPDCYGKYCVRWQWRQRVTGNSPRITWYNTRSSEPYAKKWAFEPCVSEAGDVVVGSSCDEGEWNVNIPKLNTFYYPIRNCTNVERCSYVDISTKNNIIYAAFTNEIKVLSSDQSATFVTSRQLADGFFRFKNIKGTEVDSSGKLFVLDGTLNKVYVYAINLADFEPWELIVSWGGFGTSNSTNRFSRPNDIHVDSTDNVWICDTGNRCIKLYSNTGTWIQTIKDSYFNNYPPLSLTTDSQGQVHVLTLKNIRVYSYNGEFLFEYNYSNRTSDVPTKIASNYNKEIVYIVTPGGVLKYFRNGAFAGYFAKDEQCVTNITCAVQDEFRNVLISAGTKILKYVDLMEIKGLIGPTPAGYWDLNDILIHKNEYIQNWVYNKAFQRLWDNIEFLRHILNYENTGCKKYRPPVYTKEQIFIGQNEIVTSTVINRNIKYLWDNLSSLFEYFDPDCF